MNQHVLDRKAFCVSLHFSRQEYSASENCNISQCSAHDSLGHQADSLDAEGFENSGEYVCINEVSTPDMIPFYVYVGAVVGLYVVVHIMQCLYRNFSSFSELLYETVYRITVS